MSLIVVFIAGLFMGLVATCLLMCGKHEVINACAPSPKVLTDEDTARWFRSILMKEYGRWRDSGDDEDEGSEDQTEKEAIRIGAMGVLANVIADLQLQPRPWPTERPTGAAETAVTHPEEREIA